MSLANDLNTGGVCDAMAARFASADAARLAELDQLIKAGKGDKEPPRAPRSAREVEMPRKTTKPEEPPKGPCKECGSPTCHKRTCSRRPGGPARPAPKLREVGRPRKPEPTPDRALQLATAKEATIEQLVSTIRVCQDELERRQEQLRAELDAVAKAIGDAA
jgi:hypothetical protein